MATLKNAHHKAGHWWSGCLAFDFSINSALNLLSYTPIQAKAKGASRKEFCEGLPEYFFSIFRLYSQSILLLKA